MSRMAQVLVLARYEDEVMEPLTRDDESRKWRGRFEPIPDWFVGGWCLEFFREGQRTGILKDLEALPWNSPECVQVMLHDEEDDCFGLWMFREGIGPAARPCLTALQQQAVWRCEAPAADLGQRRGHLSHETPCKKRSNPIGPGPTTRYRMRPARNCG
ncbi:hypothetical protein ACGFYU_02845 [Streptomyces sp. NPDC048337]|uniref:hypothetical protein n=1 Tax=Streptomyces sp. NPDC048337 TaxID=3365535 RepID=UPI00371A37D6